MQDVKVDFIGEYKKMGCEAEAQTIKKLSWGAKYLENKIVDYSPRAPAPAPVFVDTTPASPTPTLESPVLPRVQTPPRSLGSRRSSVDEDEKLPQVDARFLQAEDVAASDALQNASITSAFKTGVDEVVEEPSPAPAPAPAPPRRRNPRKYAVTKKMKQKDRIADDYYELLRNVA